MIKRVWRNHVDTSYELSVGVFHDVCCEQHLGSAMGHLCLSCSVCSKDGTIEDKIKGVYREFNSCKYTLLGTI